MPDPLMPDLIQITARWCMLGLVLAIGACLFRLLRGPTGADRVMALDLITILIAGGVGTLALMEGNSSLLSVALVVALISFLGTVALSIFLQHADGGNDR